MSKRILPGKRFKYFGLAKHKQNQLKERRQKRGVSDSRQELVLPDSRVSARSWRSGDLVDVQGGGVSILMNGFVESEGQMLSVAPITVDNKIVIAETKSGTVSKFIFVAPSLGSISSPLPSQRDAVKIFTSLAGSVSHTELVSYCDYISNDFSELTGYSCFGVIKKEGKYKLVFIQELSGSIKANEGVEINIKIIDLKTLIASNQSYPASTPIETEKPITESEKTVSVSFSEISSIGVDLQGDPDIQVRLGISSDSDIGSVNILIYQSTPKFILSSLTREVATHNYLRLRIDYSIEDGILHEKAQTELSKIGSSFHHPDSSEERDVEATISFSSPLESNGVFSGESVKNTIQIKGQGSALYNQSGASTTPIESSYIDGDKLVFEADYGIPDQISFSETVSDMFVVENKTAGLFYFNDIDQKALYINESDGSYKKIGTELSLLFPGVSTSKTFVGSYLVDQKHLILWGSYYTDVVIESVNEFGNPESWTKNYYVPDDIVFVVARTLQKHRTGLPFGANSGSEEKVSAFLYSGGISIIGFNEGDEEEEDVYTIQYAGPVKESTIEKNRRNDDFRELFKQTYNAFLVSL